MRFLIAGLGSIGRRHLRNLRALGEQDIILYRTHRATLPDKELAGLPVEADLQAALAHKPQAVIISNPTALHLQVAIPAAEAGCHILLEKPISHSLEGVAALEATAQRSGSRILVGFQFRFHPTLRKADEILRAGTIGKVLSARAHWGEYLPGWHPWEDYRQSYAARPDLGGGVVLTLCHPLDYLHWLLGEVEAVRAFTSASNLGLPVEDNAEISLRFASGALGSVHLDYNQRPGRHDLEIIGSQGNLRWDNANGILKIYRLATEAWDEFLPPAGFERNVMFVDEMKHFIKVVNGSQPCCTLQDGKAALQMALSAYASAQEREGARTV
jgi:predicted dehydrogenase